MKDSQAQKNPAPHERTSNQLKRVQGQVGGVIKMLDDDRDCIEIVRQVVAARNSLGRVARDILSGEVSRCSRSRQWTQLEDLLKEALR
ncbi:MAG TPA: metal-sensitive transcriptional regulator [Candidatus Woesebacteria bacterium]|jgi:DNA-binding FrmR family transcriptional regulator|nr:metal-sensitive transcriptional regulator [Candidatus Woesebacteria bacterium]